jgi:hypothetical protein
MDRHVVPNQPLAETHIGDKFNGHGPSCTVEDPIHLQLLSGTFSANFALAYYSYLRIGRGAQATRLG